MKKSRFTEEQTIGFIKQAEAGILRRDRYVCQCPQCKPSATAEKHYTVRPLDLLRMHHEKIEAWILEMAGIPFLPSAEPGKLRVVKS